MMDNNVTPAETKPNPREVHLSALAAELAEWRREKEQLSSSAPEAQVHDIDRKYQVARSALDEAEKAPAKLWVQTKAKVDDAFHAFRDAVHRTRQPQ